jgi:hypothetical protein
MLARNGEGRNASVMKSYMRYRGTGGAWRRYGVVKRGRVPEGASTVASVPREARR